MVGRHLQHPPAAAVRLHRLHLPGRRRGRGGSVLLALLDNPLCRESAAAGALALAITLALFFGNRAKCGSAFAAVTMTVWQLFVGLVVFMIFAMLDIGKKEKEKR